MVLEIYKRHQERWFLAEVYDELLRWNRWWPGARDTKGLLAWGSDDVPQLVDGTIHNFQAALYESGLDNSPMYDGVPFNPHDQPAGNGRRRIERAVRGRLPGAG